MAIRFTHVAACVVIFALFVPQSASAQTGRQRGATLGGLAGAIAGGLIGDNNDEAGAGAAIGGVVGAVAGGILGDASDKERAIAQQRAAYYNAQQQRYAQQQQRYAQQQQTALRQSAVSMQDVVNMTRSGLSDQIILNQVRQRGYNGTLTVSDIIALHQQGVSESVITSLQTIPRQPQQVTVARPQPVVTRPQTVIEHHYVPRPPVIVEQHVLPTYPIPRYRSSRGHTFYFHH
ncbi:MAG: glycine zipper domain-containing protein [Planctomycetota bacterium]